MQADAMKDGDTRPETKLEHWKAIFARQEQSGLSKTKFCAREGLNQASFYYWQKRLSQFPSFPHNKAKTPLVQKFVPVKIREEQTRENQGLSAVEMKLPNGVSLKIYPGTSRALLEMALQTLGMTTC